MKAVQDRGGVHLVDTDKSILHFKVHSGTKDLWYENGIQFKGLTNILKNLIYLDRSVWKEDRSNIDFRKLAMSLLDNAEIRLSCSCPAIQYWGGNYILSRPKRDAKIGEPENRPPVQRNPREYGATCKHGANLLKALPFYGPTIASWLKEFHAKEIAGIVKDYKTEIARIKGKKTKAVEEPEKAKAPGKEPTKTEPAKEKPKEGTPKVKEKPRKAKEEKPEVKISAEVKKEPKKDKEEKESILRFNSLSKIIEDHSKTISGGFIHKDGYLISIKSSHYDYISSWAERNNVDEFPEDKMMKQFYDKTGYVDFVLFEPKIEFDVRIFSRITNKQLETIKNKSILYNTFYWDIWGEGKDNRLKSGRDFNSLELAIREFGLLRD